jgi:hypothetical protein
VAKKLPITAIFRDYDKTTVLVLVYISRYPPLSVAVFDVPLIKLGRLLYVRSLLITLKVN